MNSIPHAIAACLMLAGTSHLAAAGEHHALNPEPVRGGDVLFADGFVITPDSSGVIYLADQDRDNFHELYHVSIEGGEPVRLSRTLSAGESVAAEGVRLSSDGRNVAYLAGSRRGSAFQLYVVSATGGESIRLNPGLSTGGSVLDEGLDFLPNGDAVIYRAVLETDSPAELFSSRVTDGRWTRLSADLGDVAPAGVTITPDSSSVLFIAGSPFTGPRSLYSVSPMGGAPVSLTPGLGEGQSVESHGMLLSPDGRLVAFRVADESANTVTLHVGSVDGSRPARAIGPAISSRQAVLGVGLQPVASHAIMHWVQELGGGRDLWVAGPGGDNPGTKVIGSGQFAGQLLPAPVFALPESGAVVLTALDRASSKRQVIAASLDGGPDVRDLTPAVGELRSVQPLSGLDRVLALMDADTSGKVELYSVSLAGDHTVRLNHDLGRRGHVLSAKATPSGSAVLFLADQDGAGRYRLYAVSPMGGDPVPVHGELPDAAQVLSYSISPDESWVVFTADGRDGGKFELFASPMPALSAANSARTDMAQTN